ncbi:MAG: DM13 domain-containing protein [Pseudomonadota bacterium]
MMIKKALSAAAFAALSLSAAATMIAPAAYAQEDAAETVVASGSWTKKSFKSNGTWQIVERADGHYVVLDDDFKTRRAPDLKIFLSPNSAASLSGSNATDGSVLVAELSSNSGAQEYKIPEGTDLTAFQTILIHCQAFSKLWSVAAI